MRRFLTLIASVAILALAYVVTFGIPLPVAAMIGGTDAAAEGTASDTPKSGPSAGPARGPGGSGRATAVVTAPLTLQPYETTLNAIGTAAAIRSIDVVSTVSGTVTEANLVENRNVATDDVLLRLDARTESFNLEIAQANYEQASDTVTRYERIRATGNSTVTDVTLAEARVQQRLAEAAVGLAQVAVDDRVVRAPIAGKLSLSTIEVGDVLSANAVIATIDQSDTLVIEFELAERAIGLLKDAKAVQVSTATFRGRVFEGDIMSYDSRIDSVTRSVTVKAKIDNPDGILWPGMTFAVRLAQESAPLPTVPSTAIAWSRAGSNIWVDQDGVAKMVPVTIVSRRDDTVWIDAQIGAGTMVVTEGAQKLREGARISAPASGMREKKTRETSEADTANKPEAAL
jgi:RND family efflux transporter MFP subunit